MEIIEQIRNDRQNLEQVISRLLTDFQNKYEVTISNITTTSISYYNDGKFNNSTEVKIDVKI